MNEAWKPIVGYEGVYEVSNIGRIRRIAGGRGARPGMRKLSLHPNGYVQVVLSMNNRTSTKKVHRLVAEAFLGPCPPGMEACHTNDVPGDNRVENLRWDTHRANCIDRSTNGKPRRAQKLRTVCRNGLHEMTDENTKLTKQGWRACRECYAAKEKRALKGYDPDAACRNGHARTESNVYVAPDGRRDCRDCRQKVDRKRRATQAHKQSRGALDIEFAS